MKLQNLLRLFPFAQVVNGNENPDIVTIEQDHREVKKGTLFICIKGANFDGHEFAIEAEKRGAVAFIASDPISVKVPVIYVNDTNRAMALVSDAFYNRPSHSLFLIGVTGTNGKTSVSHIIDHMFKFSNKRTGLIGSLYVKIGEETFTTKNTTPDSLTLQKTFAEMVKNNTEIVTMEVSSHALEMGRVWGTDYQIAVFTNLTQDHLDFHHTMEKYQQAKSLLFSQLGNKYEDKQKFAILNADDAVTPFFTKSTACQIIRYGVYSDAEVMAEKIQFNDNRTVFLLKTPVGKRDVHVNLMGLFNVYNVLAAVSVGLAYGLSLDLIVRALHTFNGIPGRFEIVEGSKEILTIVDYAHTPDSLENVLKTIQTFATNDVFVVVGCGGDRDRTKRPKMAEIACQYATKAIFTSDNPRSENPADIIADMIDGLEYSNYQIVLDRRAAILQAISEAKQGDVILIAGKGHETYQIIGTEKIAFDDRLIAKEGLSKRQLL